jgi:hypothetical protein
MNQNGKMIGDRCEPAASVIAKFGGVRALARELRLDPSAVSKWQISKGGAGLIPAKYHWTLLKLARAKAVALTAGDLVGHP